MLKREMLSLMASYGLPEGVTYKSFTGKELGTENQDRLMKWCGLAGLLYADPSEYDGWYSISVSTEYGKSVWGPGVYASPVDGAAVVVLGPKVHPLTDLKGWTLVETSDGFCLIWPDEDETYTLKLNLLSEIVVAQDKLRKSLKGDCSKLLRTPVIRYPKLSALEVGTYKVVGVLTYAGFEGKPTKAIQIEMPDGSLVWYQANTKVQEALLWEPEVTFEKSATLKILSHSKTKQGHPMVNVSFEVDVEEPDKFFRLKQNPAPLDLSPAED